MERRSLTNLFIFFFRLTSLHAKILHKEPNAHSVEPGYHSVKKGFVFYLLYLIEQIFVSIPGRVLYEGSHWIACTGPGRTSVPHKVWWCQSDRVLLQPSTTLWLFSPRWLPQSCIEKKKVITWKRSSSCFGEILYKKWCDISEQVQKNNCSFCILFNIAGWTQI